VRAIDKEARSAQAVFVLDALDAFVERLLNALERLHRRHDFTDLDVAEPVKNCDLT